MQRRAHIALGKEDLQDAFSQTFHFPPQSIPRKRKILQYYEDLSDKSKERSKVEYMAKDSPVHVLPSPWGPGKFMVSDH